MVEEDFVTDLEEQLVKTLRPIKPREEFVQGLKNRVHGLKRLILDNDTEVWVIFIILLLSIISLSLLIALFVRGLFRLLEIK